MRESPDRKLKIENCKMQNANWAAHDDRRGDSVGPASRRAGEAQQIVRVHRSPIFNFQFSIFNLQSVARCIVLLLVPALVGAAARTEASSAPEIAAVRAGFAGRYKVGVRTPLEVTVRGGDVAHEVRVRATLADSDGVNCTFESEPCRVLPGQDANIPLCVLFRPRERHAHAGIAGRRIDRCLENHRFGTIPGKRTDSQWLGARPATGSFRRRSPRQHGKRAAEFRGQVAAERRCGGR